MPAAGRRRRGAVVNEEIKRALNNDEFLLNAIAVFKIAMDAKEKPTDAFRKALGSVVMQMEEAVATHRPGPMRPDEQVALANTLIREQIKPRLPDGEGCCLILFPLNQPGLMTYIANADREGCRIALRNLLNKWDAEAALARKGGT